MKTSVFASSLAIAALLSACASTPHGPTAAATLRPTRGNTAAGVVTFEQTGPGHVQVRGQLRGLKPNQAHGFHAHEKGDCSSADGTSAGGHFNPGGEAHGHASHAHHHAGDFPVVVADANGVAELRFEVDGVSIGAGPGDLVGRGLILHANPDDYTTQPTGNSGARIACGVIELVPARSRTPSPT